MTTIYNNSLPFHSLDELRSYNDERFIRLAFQSILGREPDSEGLNTYKTHLRSTLSHKDLLDQLRRSDEYKTRHSIIEHGRSRDFQPWDETPYRTLSARARAVALELCSAINKLRP